MGSKDYDKYLKHAEHSGFEPVEYEFFNNNPYCSNCCLSDLSELTELDSKGSNEWICNECKDKVI